MFKKYIFVDYCLRLFGNIYIHTYIIGQYLAIRAVLYPLQDDFDLYGFASCKTIFGRS